MRKKGFTLIELAIVLTIIGLLIGGSFKMMKMMRERAKIAEAKEQVLAAKNAVIGYAIEWPNLPTQSEFDANISAEHDANFKMYYVADTNLTAEDVCAFSSTELKVQRQNGTIVDDVAFLIAHGSINDNLQTMSISNKVKIYSPSDTADDNPTPRNRAEQYDDIVEFVTLFELKEVVGCNNKPFRFVTDKLPNAKVDVVYPSISGTAKLEVENALDGETVSMDCTPRPQSGIDFNTTTNGFNFHGTPTTATILNFECNATVSNSAQFAQKKFSITIDPNYNKETNATCTLDSECGGGYCVNSKCTSGIVGDSCVNGGDCASGFCVGGVCTTGTFDANCTSGGDCKSGICYGGVCGGAIGSSCSSSTQCLSGYCDGISCALMPSGE